MDMNNVMFLRGFLEDKHVIHVIGLVSKFDEGHGQEIAGSIR